MGLDADLLFSGGSQFLDLQRARVLADRSSGTFLKAYEAELGGASTATARHAATELALTKTEKRLALQVATENAHAFNHARQESRIAGWDVHLYKLWDAYLDKKTCPVCSDLDGLAIPKADKFRDRFNRVVKPGKVHPYCRCLEEYITIQEARRYRIRAAARGTL